MRPIDQQGNEWPPEFSRARLKLMRAECVSAMRGRDEKRSGGRLCAGNGYRPYTVIADKSKGGRYTPQTDLVRIRHKGQDTRKLLAGQWAEFCAQPQDLEAWKKTHMATSRAEEIANMRAFAKVDEEPEATPAKRGPGRPPKSRTDAETATAP